MPSLPPELVEAILFQCDKTTLLFSAQATTVAEQYFYKFLHVNSTERGKQLVTALSNPKHGERRQKIVRGVRLFQIMDMNACTTLLQLLPELKRLNIVNWCGGFTLPPEGGFPFQLRRLRLVNECDHLTPEDFVTFLEHQQQLEVLELVLDESPRRRALVCARARDTGAPLLLPQLTTLLASEDMVLAFLSQQRPLFQEIKVRVKNWHLAIDREALPSAALYDAIKASAGNLQSLLLGTNDVAQTIRLLADVCPRLDTLKLIFDCTGAFKEFHQVFEIRDLGQEIALPDFPSLRKLVLHPVGLTLQHESESLSLARGSKLVIHPGICSVMPKLKVCGIHAFAGPVSNPTIIFPPREMGRPASAGVADWHPLHENFKDQAFFCDK